jgi:hypothetical protein
MHFFADFFEISPCGMTELRVLVQQSNSVNVVFKTSLILKHYIIISLKPGFQHQKHTCHVGFLKSAHSTYIHVYEIAEKSLAHFEDSTTMRAVITCESSNRT